MILLWMQMSFRNQNPCCLFNLGKGLMKTLESWWGFLWWLFNTPNGSGYQELWFLELMYWSMWTTLQELVCEKDSKGRAWLGGLYQSKIKVLPLRVFVTKASKSNVEEMSKVRMFQTSPMKTPVAFITGCGEFELGTSTVPCHERFDEQSIK